MVKVTDASDAVISEYRYDPLNRRIRKFTEPSEGNWTVREYYYNNQWQNLEVRKEVKARSGTPLSEPAVAAAVCEQYLWSPRYIDAPILRDRDADANSGTGNLGGTGSGLEERHYYTTDGNGNVTALTDTSGAAVERYVYDPYGKPTIYNNDWTATVSWANSEQNEILYCGYRFDPESSLYHVRNRMYDYSLGRWLQRDPKGYVDGMNLYEYVRSRATVFTDPQGTTIVGNGEIRDYLAKHGLVEVQQGPAKNQPVMTRYSSPHVQDYNENTGERLDRKGQILAAMLVSKRTFYIGNGSVEQLDLHVQTRLNIITAAEKIRFGMPGRAADIRYNPDYWEIRGGVPVLKRNVRPSEAINDMFQNPEKYSVPCEMALRAAVAYGTMQTIGRDAFDKGLNGRSPLTSTDEMVFNRTGYGPGYGRSSTPGDAWVPGDWGQVRNTKWDPHRPGGDFLDRENVLYLGNENFWGHVTRRNVRNVRNVRTLPEWVGAVHGWMGGAVVSPERATPKAGLERMD
jgi:RHS repeat-associated protein